MERIDSERQARVKSEGLRHLMDRGHLRLALLEEAAAAGEAVVARQERLLKEVGEPPISRTTRAIVYGQHLPGDARERVTQVIYREDDEGQTTRRIRSVRA